ncbi:hypothetical protein BDV96DRAFT_487269 [Lophiotrema nucula]|uniref:Uncharacterized protein n=1 Tax=Lophiotrema nucula TaxID=690887 RepID=A0A6A5ZJJ4_9PLEO|nr:hypothetical protein BDV96DRAFT_487269 [Lophiotrema nucula]
MSDPLGDKWQQGRTLQKPSDPNALILEAWAQGYMVGSLIIMAFITMANMRRGNLLHKLLMGLWQGFWLFFNSPVYAWWLSVSAIFLNASWSLHNVIAWMKIKPFLSKWVSWFFIGTVILVQPYWVVEIYANFAYFHGVNKWFTHTRPYEALCRDPWWIFTTVALFWNIKTRYEMTLTEIVRISPRFGIMLGAMILSIIFIALDICSVTGAFKSSLPVGINPFWKLAFVFKCLTDSVVLDDFKTALDRLRAFKMSRLGSFSQDTSDRRTWDDGGLINTWEEIAAEAGRRNPGVLPSPDGDYVHSSHFPGLKPERRHKEHKDSAVSPDGIKSADWQSNLSDSNGLQPEDIVPSHIESPQEHQHELRTLDHAHVAEKDVVEEWDDLALGGAGHLTNELDYMKAMREVEGKCVPSSPIKTTFSRRSTRSSMPP